MAELPKTYSPSEIEGPIFKRWEASRFFNPDKLPNAKKRKPFVISMPPPNITGELHLGHALGMTIQDILTRYHRMNGRAALWLPGTDHAAIATQVLVERDLRKQGVDPKSLGREKFLTRVWAWKEKYGRQIVDQVKRMGASADWSRERFTMDDGLTVAVQTAFVTLYKDGLIYRGERIINWCPVCGTAISDLEVDHQETPGKLWRLRYILSDGSGHIDVATTRPETMLGDTAVAVNPNDGRYASLIGKSVVVPIAQRQIPIIGDARINSEFGTGAVKVTPAHDPLDFDIGQDHTLQMIRVIGFDGRMTDEAGPGFKGKTVSEARQFILRSLQNTELVGEEDYIHSVGYCSRSKTLVEPLVSRQWFVTMKPLAKPALKAVRSGKIKIVPERYEKVYYHWLENIRDWNISRQIWWGHRLPVWYKKSDSHKDNPKISLKSPGPTWVQDNDTLDTWFSSGLWTFSTLGWPKATADLKRFHPTDVMETGWDILFFWVARMIMLSLHLRGEIPFKTVYLHGLILDEQGKKMSKSKGTGIDPLPIADKYGMDALRMSLIIGNAPGQDFRMYEKKIEGYRNFANKLWNIARYILTTPDGKESKKELSIADRWITARLQATITAVTKRGIERYDFSAAGQTLYDFLWHDFADWYLEASKISPNQKVLREVFMTSLKLLHPFMPFITEHLWSFFGGQDLLMVAPWPKAGASANTKAVQSFEAIQQTVVALRNFKTHSDLPAGAVGEYLGDLDASYLAGLSRVQLRHRDRLTVSSDHATITLGQIRFQFDRTFVERYESWRQKERAELERYAIGIEKKLANTAFVANAPAEVVIQERQKLAEVKQRLLEL